MVSPLSAQAQSAFNDPGAAVAGGGTTGDLVAVSPTVDAGGVALGSSSQVVMLFRNDDIKPLNVGEISLYPSSNVSSSIAENKCAGEPLAPQAVCAVAFSVKGLQSGRFRIEILMRHDGRARLLTSSISGTVEASGNDAGQRNSDIEVLPEELDFGTLSASRSQVKSVMLRNITSEPIDVKSMTIQSSTQSGYSISGECSTLKSGGACVVSVTWTPQQIGPATGTLLVSHTGPTGMASVPLTGTYTPTSSAAATVFADAVPGKGLLVASLSEIAFGDGIEKSSSITVSLVNAGDAPLTLNNIRLSNSENGLVVESTGCVKGRVLNPIEACPMTLTWTPVRTGNILDDVTVTHTGARGILVLPVRGSATQAVSKDSQAINLNDFNDIPRLSVTDVEGADGEQGSQPASPSRSGSADLSEYKVKDVRGLLDGYAISSLAANRAIITGPGGSRVVSNGENAVIGGVPWFVSVKQGAVQFMHDGQSIVLLFDRSLSFINSTSTQSGSTSSTGSSAPSPAVTADPGP